MKYFSVVMVYHISAGCNECGGSTYYTGGTCTCSFDLFYRPFSLPPSATMIRGLQAIVSSSSFLVTGPLSLRNLLITTDCEIDAHSDYHVLQYVFFCFSNYLYFINVSYLVWF